MDEKALPDPLLLRGHHVLCVLGFRGLGYSEDFVANMTRVVQLIREQPEAMLRLTDSADAICQACPHLARQRCSRDKGAAARVTQRDVAVLRQLGVKAGTEISVGRAYTLVREKFTPEIMARETCAGCSWQHHGYCAEGLERLKSQDSPAASCDTPMEPA